MISNGKNGKNLTLTINMKLQKQVEEIIEKRLKEFKGSEPLLDRAFVVMMDPKQVNFYPWLEKISEKDGNIKVEDYALGTLTSSYELGSTVKGATLLTGFETGSITP